MRNSQWMIVAVANDGDKREPPVCDDYLSYTDMVNKFLEWIKDGWRVGTFSVRLPDEARGVERTSVTPVVGC